MRLVLDANQAGRVAEASAHSSGIVLSPLVLAEVVLSPHGEGALKRLATHDLTIGLTTSDVTARISELTRTQILAFVPFPEAGVAYQNSYDGMLSLLHGETPLSDPEVQTWARQLKEQGESDSQRA